MTEAAESTNTQAADAPFEIVRRPAPAGSEGLVIDIIGYRERVGQLIRQTESAALVAPLIISFGEPFEIGLGREPGRNDRYGSFAAGLCAAPALINSYGAAHCLQVNFTPLGARRFFARPMRELADRMVTIDDLEDRALGELRQRLGEERSWPARFALVERYVADRLNRGAAVSPTTQGVFDRIVASGGCAPIARLAREVEWSRKHLAARFGEEIGVPPKTIARIVRFNHAQKLATARRGTGWADIAAACGYSDQAHLTREFRDLAGATPAAWLAAA